MNTKLAEYRVNDFIPIRLEIMVKSLELRDKYSELTFFDSIHMAMAVIITQHTLLTNDETMMKIMKAEGIRYLDYHSLT